MTDLRQLRQIAAVAKLASFSRAAQKLNISQPALSRSIGNFEAAAGVRLFDRTARGVIPTPFAIPLLRDIENLLAHADRLERDLRESAGGAAGEIAFGVGPMVSSYLLPGLLADMALASPHVKIEAKIAAAAALRSSLERGQIEFFIVARNLVQNPAGLEIERLASVDLGLLVRKGHPLEDRQPVQLQDLAAFPIATGSQPDEVFSRSSPAVVLPSQTIICENFAILEECTLNSDMIWITSPQLVSARNAGALLPLRVSGWGPNRLELVAVSAIGQTKSPLALAILAKIRIALRPLG